jgi:hypothetical protein
MPPTNDPAHQHSKQAPRIRRKTKPRFEIPLETGSAVTPVEWVYRTDDASTPPSPAARRPTEDRSKTDPFLATGTGLFFVGAVTVGLVSLVALGLVTAPIGIAKGFLARYGLS